MILMAEPTYRPIKTAADADSIRDQIAEVLDDWYPDHERIDWDDFYDRLEGGVSGLYDLGEDLRSPAIKRIHVIVRELRREL